MPPRYLRHPKSNVGWEDVVRYTPNARRGGTIPCWDGVPPYTQTYDVGRIRQRSLHSNAPSPTPDTLIRVTDTHCHLDYLETDELEAALYAARDFRAILTIGTDPVKNRKALEIAEKTPNVWAAVGLHPTEAERLSPELEADLGELVQYPKVRAIGESGLDFYWKPETRSAQYRALDFQAQLARSQGLPLILHVRSAKGSDAAESELAEWLLLHRPPRFVLHAYGGNLRLLEVGLELGGYVSFAGPLTYKGNDALRAAAKEVPLDRLLVETDSPFLPPEPHRGQRNHPALVRHTLERLAAVRDIPAKMLEQTTDENAQRLFGF